MMDKEYYMEFVIDCKTCGRRQRFRSQEEVEENIKVHRKYGCWNCWPTVDINSFRTNLINKLGRRKQILYTVAEADLYLKLWEFGEYKVYWMLNQIYDE